MSPDASDQVESAKRVIDDNRYLTLDPADGQGNPWVSPVWYATNGYTEFLWLSSADARHSKNIATRSRVALVIFDSRSAPTDARALYIDGHANEVKKRELERAQGVFSAASLAEGLPTGRSRTSCRRCACACIELRQGKPSCSKTMKESESLSDLRLSRSVMRPLPAACTLTSDAAAERRLAWQALADHALIEQRETECGVTLSYSAASGIQAKLRDWRPWRPTAAPLPIGGSNGAGTGSSSRSPPPRILSTRCRQCSPSDSGKRSG